ncbi:unnamed protein product [Adineta steineri]|uniref:Uncharacterized protein n=1 Tax=Adineta steineri TaxID=433720 RepID=A0A814PDK5_9BILA|nr:unnamed protein product [Adineta steineri]CAF1280954.1 unnamed protein product [Adineta steineri]
MFALRDDPFQWYLDDVSIMDKSGHQLLSNGGFETGDTTDWIYCNPRNATYSGHADSTCAHTASYCYLDGSVGASDYLSQTFTVAPYNNYAIKFYLSAESNSSTFAQVYVTS